MLYNIDIDYGREIELLIFDKLKMFFHIKIKGSNGWLASILLW